MIVCRECGFENEDAADFCANPDCGEFLEWKGERIPDPEPPVVEPPPDEEPTEEDDRRGLVERLRDSLGLERDEAEAVADVPGTAEAVESADTEEEAADTEEEAAGGEAASRDDRVRREVADRAATQERVAEEARDRAERSARVRGEAAARARRQAERAEEAHRRAEEMADEDVPEDERAAARVRAEAEAAEARRLRREAGQAEDARREAEEEVRRRGEEAERARRARRLVAPPRRPERSRPREPDTGRPTDDVGTGAGQADRTPAGGEASRPAATGRGDAQPGPVRPDQRRTRRAPPRRVRQKRRLRPGDLICGQCGEGNDPSRHYCRRCGAGLAEAETVRPGLLDRLKGLVRRRRRPPPAGTRPGRGGGGGGAVARGRAGRRRVLRTWFTVMKVLAIAAVALAVVGVTVSPLRQQVAGRLGDAVDWVRRAVVPRFEPVSALTATASSESPDHPASHAVDGFHNRWWAEAAPGPGDGERLFVDFGGPVDIAKVGFLSGAGEEAFLAQPRPREVHLVFSNGATADMTLEDKTEFQVFDVEGAEGVTEVEVQILSVYAGQEGEELSLREIEFRTRR